MRYRESHTKTYRLFVISVLTALVVPLLFTSVSAVESTQSDIAGKESIESFRTQYEERLFVGTGAKPCEEPGRILCFSVAKDGSFAIVTNTDRVFYVDVYDASFLFRYQLLYDYSGDVWCFFDSIDSDPNIAFIRDDIFVKTDPNGSFVFSKKMTKAGVENGSVHKVSSIVEYNGNIYECEGYHRFVVKDRDGAVLFEYAPPRMKTMIWLDLMLGVYLIAIIYLKKLKVRIDEKVKKWNEENNN